MYNVSVVIFVVSLFWWAGGEGWRKRGLIDWNGQGCEEGNGTRDHGGGGHEGRERRARWGLTRTILLTEYQLPIGTYVVQYPHFGSHDQ